ncbi:MAG: hypothetical protein ACXWE6_12575 [Nitrososphaeraceae archaeon]
MSDNNNNNVNVLKTPLKLTSTITVGQQCFICENFVKILKNSNTNSKDENYVFDELNELFKQHLLSIKIYDVKVDCQSYVKKIVEKTVNETAALDSLLELKLKHENPSHSNRLAAKKRKAALEIKNNPEIKSMRPRGYTKTLWDAMVELEHVYRGWQDELPKKAKIDGKDEKKVDKENIDPGNSNNNNNNITTDELTKKAKQKIEKEAMDKFRKRLMKDAHRKYEIREEERQEKKNLMARTNSLIDKCEAFIQKELNMMETKQLMMEKSIEVMDKILNK